MTTDSESSSAPSGSTGAHALSSYHSVFAVVSGLTLLQAATAALLVVVALTLKSSGASNFAIGAVASAYSLGFILGARLSPREIGRIGHIRAYALFAAMAAIIALVFTLKADAALWAVLQAAAGTFSAALFTAGESWIANAAPPSRRGAILGFYHLVSKLGSIAGPFAVASAEPGLAGFMIVSALFAASLVPVTATSRAQPEISSAEPFGLRSLWRRAPAAVIAAFIAGLVNNSVAQLYPVYVSMLNLNGARETSALFNAALLAGALATLMPAGWLSDRLDRRVVIAILAGVGAMASAGLVLCGQTGGEAGIWLFAVLFGAGSFSFYGIAVAHGADRSRPEETTSVMAGILMIWGTGAVIGPTAAGLVMSLGAGGEGLFIFAGTGLSILALSTGFRTLVTRPVPADDKEPFNTSPATSLAIAEFDPRGEDGQLDLFAQNERAAQ